MTQTDRQIDTHTDTLGSIATYSVKLTEYKKDRLRLDGFGSGRSGYGKNTFFVIVGLRYFVSRSYPHYAICLIIDTYVHDVTKIVIV